MTIQCELDGQVPARAGGLAWKCRPGRKHSCWAVPSAPPSVRALLHYPTWMQLVFGRRFDRPKLSAVMARRLELLRVVPANGPCGAGRCRSPRLRPRCWPRPRRPRHARSPRRCVREMFSSTG